MFANLCVLAEQLMPGARKRQADSDMMELRRDDGQFLFLGMSFYTPKHPVIVVSVFEETAARLGVTAETTSLRVNDRNVSVRVTRGMDYVNQPVRFTISYGEPLTVHPENRVSTADVLRVLVSAF
jgi:hypothetical protein